MRVIPGRATPPLREIVCLSFSENPIVSPSFRRTSHSSWYETRLARKFLTSSGSASAFKTSISSLPKVLIPYVYPEMPSSVL